jgi:hypothetical protein
MSVREAPYFAVHIFKFLDPVSAPTHSSVPAFDKTKIKADEWKYEEWCLLGCYAVWLL